MSKSIYEKALGILKNRVSKLHINHKIGNKDIAKLEILDIAKAIENHVMPIFEQAITELERLKKQEKLQDLYKEYFNLRTLPIIFNTVFYRLQEIEKQIKELENDKKGGERK